MVSGIFHFLMSFEPPNPRVQGIQTVFQGKFVGLISKFLTLFSHLRTNFGEFMRFIHIFLPSHNSLEFLCILDNSKYTGGDDLHSKS
jgi:hypothetical protein